MVIKRYFILFSILSLLTNLANAQEVTTITGTNLKDTVQSNAADTIPMIEIEDLDLDNIISLRAQFEKQNQSYSAPVTPNENLLRFLKKDEVELSDEAMYWARLVRDASTIFDANMTFQDTVIADPLFLPLIFKGKLLPKDLSFYDEDAWKNKIDIPQPFLQDTIFKEEVFRQQFREKAQRNIEANHPEYFRYSMRDLPQDKVVAKVIRKPTYQPDLIKVESEADFSDVDAPVKFIPERPTCIPLPKILCAITKSEMTCSVSTVTLVIRHSTNGTTHWILTSKPSFSAVMPKTRTLNWPDCSHLSVLISVLV